jgi:hypothetical protein
MELQRELAAASTNAYHRVIPGARHYIDRDDPGAVVDAIGDVIAAARSGSRVASPQK